VSTSAERRCYFCGQPVKADAEFCVSCGRRQAPPVATVVPRSSNRGFIAAMVAFGGLSVFGCLALCVGLLLVASVPNPVALTFATIAAIVPAVSYSLLVLLLDRFESEPWYTLLGAFLWGAIISIVFSVIFELISGGLVLVAWGEGAADIFGTVIAAPVFEESTKGAALVVLLLAFRHELDSTLDGIIYGALVGLGFAMTENILYYGSSFLEGGFVGLVVVFFIRAGIGGFSHALFTACTGAGIGWARSQYGQGGWRFVAPFAGLALAMFLHGAWNGSSVLATYLDISAGGVLVLLGFLFFGLVVPPFIAVLIIAYMSWRRQLGILRVQLEDEVRQGTISQDEYAMLTNPGLRRRAHWTMLFSRGVRSWIRQHRFSRLTSQLAFQKYHAAHGEAKPSGFGKRSDAELRAAIAQVRTQLFAA
jgi:protease PrsW